MDEDGFRTIGNTDTACVVCGQAGGQTFLRLDNMPLFCNVLWDTPAEALAAPRGAIRLACCPSCGMIRNTAFDAACLRYGGRYENSLHFSPHFQAYAQRLCDQLVERYRLRGKTIVEVGCGGGEFLRQLCRRGENKGLGFDPSCTADDDLHVTIMREPYAPWRLAAPADFVCCRHVLEHIDQPLELLDQIRQGLAGAAGAYFEVPDALYMLNQQAIWDVIYEHCNYFTPQAMETLLRRSGFAPFAIRHEYGGQFLSVQCAVGEACGTLLAPPQVQLQDLTAEFSMLFQAKTQLWRQRLQRLAGAGRRAVVWGAGSKGVTFLNVLGLDSAAIPYVVDLNPSKHGRFVPGTAQQVIAPAALKDYRCDVVIVMNAIYTDEIRQSLAELDLSCQLMTA